MADMHRIRLYQTTWAEAQALMRKWGAWGHWDGTCTADDCEYAVSLGVPLFWEDGKENPGWLSRFLFPRAIILPGGRFAGLQATFTVHQGTVWRTGEKIAVDVPPRWFSRDLQDGGDTLLLKVKSRQQLNPEVRGDRILGSMDQLAEHPYFVSGSPSGCEICLAGEVTYSTRTPQWQIDELTNFNFSCFTRWQPCRFLRDLYPEADRWQTMGWMFDVGRPRKMPVPTASECDIPGWALGRDFNSVSEVEALTVESVKDERYAAPRLKEEVKVKVLLTIKGSRRMEGLTVNAYPFAGNSDDFDYEVPEHMQVGRRYLLLWQDEGSDRPLPPGFALERCGVQADTPEVREELKKGFAMNDGYVDHWQY